MTDAPDTSNEDLGEVTIVREFDAPREVIFAALMDPQQLTHFWGPPGIATPVDKIVIEPFVGGRFITVMVHEESGQEFPNAGHFTVMEEPERYAFKEDESGVESMNTFEDLGDGRTRMTIHQTNVPPMYRTPEALAGFNQALDKLVAYLAQR